MELICKVVWFIKGLARWSGAALSREMKIYTFSVALIRNFSFPPWSIRPAILTSRSGTVRRAACMSAGLGTGPPAALSDVCVWHVCVHAADNGALLEVRRG